MLQVAKSICPIFEFLFLVQEKLKKNSSIAAQDLNSTEITWIAT